MILKGLEKQNKLNLAHKIALNHVENVVKCFCDTNTVWENYSPDEFGKNSSKRGDFVGWTGLVPIAVLFEFVMGIKSNVPENKIVWDVNLTCRHGIKNYPFGPDKTIDLICEERKSEDEKPVIYKSNNDVEVYINWKGGNFKI